MTSHVRMYKYLPSVIGQYPFPYTGLITKRQWYLDLKWFARRIPRGSAHCRHSNRMCILDSLVAGPDYAFERTVMRLHGAPRAQRQCAPTALGLVRRAAAQRGC